MSDLCNLMEPMHGAWLLHLQSVWGLFSCSDIKSCLRWSTGILHQHWFQTVRCGLALSLMYDPSVIFFCFQQWANKRSNRWLISVCPYFVSRWILLLRCSSVLSVYQQTLAPMFYSYSQFTIVFFLDKCLLLLMLMKMRWRMKWSLYQ